MGKNCERHWKFSQFLSIDIIMYLTFIYQISDGSLQYSQNYVTFFPKKSYFFHIFEIKMGKNCERHWKFSQFLSISIFMYLTFTVFCFRIFLCGGRFLQSNFSKNLFFNGIFLNKLSFMLKF